MSFGESSCKPSLFYHQRSEHIYWILNTVHFSFSGERKSDCHSHNSFQGLSPQRHIMPAEVIWSGCNPFPGVNASRHRFNVLQCLPLQREFYSTLRQSIVKKIAHPLQRSLYFPALWCNVCHVKCQLLYTCPVTIMPVEIHHLSLQYTPLWKVQML